MIKVNLKSQLIKLFKDNKNIIPSISNINKIAKNNDVPSIEIEKWFKWIETIYMYMNVKNNLIKLNDSINTKEELYEISSKSMIIKKPNITSQ